MSGVAPWTLDQALQFIRQHQPLVMERGWCLLLGGGVLNTGSSASDLDLLVYPRTRGSSRQRIQELFPGGTWSSAPEASPVAEVYTVLLPTQQRIEFIFQTWAA